MLLLRSVTPVPDSVVVSVYRALAEGALVLPISLLVLALVRMPRASRWNPLTFIAQAAALTWMPVAMSDCLFDAEWPSAITYRVADVLWLAAVVIPLVLIARPRLLEHRTHGEVGDKSTRVV